MVRFVIRGLVQIDWKDEANKPVTPKFLGTKVIKDVAIEDVIAYIDWNPFFQVWAFPYAVERHS